MVPWMFQFDLKTGNTVFTVWVKSWTFENNKRARILFLFVGVEYKSIYALALTSLLD